MRVSPWRACAALGLDVAVLGVRVLAYPLGVLPGRSDAVDTAGGTPVVLVHGVVDNRSAFRLLESSLRRRGFRHIAAINYPITTVDVRAAARQLADQVHLVGHSLGGVVARWYVQCDGGDARTASVVTLGSPHEGTHAAWLLPLPVLRQLRPGSDIVRALAAPARCRTRFVSVWSEQDAVVVPRRAAALVHADLDVTNVELRGVGHLALTSHPRALAAVAEALLASESPVPQRVQSFSSGA